MEKVFQSNGTKKQIGVALQISDKAVFKPKLIKSDSSKEKFGRGVLPP